MGPSSARLGYRRLSASDAGAFHALCLDSHVRRYLLDGQCLPREWAIETIERSDRLFESEGVGLWFVMLDGSPVGFCGYHRFDASSAEPQLLYALLPSAVGRGYATEAATAMLDEARRLGWTRVVAAVDRPNEASRRVLDKLGFACRGRVPGAFGDTLLFERVDGPELSRIDAPCGTRWRLNIASSWDGTPAPGEDVAVDLELADIELTLRIDAPFHGDPPPASSDRLWEHEVVELMLLGDDDRYLEVELSPHGNHLVLMLHGVRRVVHRDLLLDYHAAIDAGRWTGCARIPLLWLPPRTTRLNAFAMHGDAPRRYLAWKSPRRAPQGEGKGERPDFHRLEAFERLDAYSVDSTTPSSQ